MKNFLLVILLMSFMSMGVSQEIQLNLKNISTSGINSDKGDVNISKWRIGTVKTLTLGSSNLNENISVNWNVKPFPNPFTENLFLNLSTGEEREFAIQITDILGKTSCLEKRKVVLKNETLDFNLSHLKPSMYFIRIISIGENTQKTLKIQKQ